MSVRRRDDLYAGAKGRIDLASITKLGSRYALVPKSDGAYATIMTDKTGRISSIITRSGELLSPSLMSEFSGIHWSPSSVLVGEIELWTEASNRAAAMRGYRMIHLFDAQRIDGEDLTRLAYRARRDALMRAESRIVQDDLDRPWIEDSEGDAHDPKTGRYKARVPRSWRRIRVLPQLAVSQLDTAMADWIDGQTTGPVEGLVVVALDACLGKPGAKKKCKPTSTIDAVVTSLDERAMSVFWMAGGISLALGRPSSLDIKPGDVVEVLHEGFTDSGIPKFARAMRPRPDMALSKYA